jgi:hypothetical protein
MEKSMPDPFESVLWKIGRAKVHIEAAKQIFQSFAQSNAYVLSGDFDRKRWVFTLTVDTVAPLPTDLSLTIGDAAHNARSALDHLMFVLAKPKSKQEARYVYFPIGRTHRNFMSMLKNRKRNPIPGVPRGVKAVLESLQPYHRRKRPKAAYLWELKQIDDWDKHRTLSTTTSAVSGIDASATFKKVKGTTALIDKKLFPGILNPGAVLARLKFLKSAIEPDVQMHPKLIIHPVFGSGTAGEIEGLNVVDTVRRAINFIESDVVPSFRPFV